jgi:hypothetical protein
MNPVLFTSIFICAFTLIYGTRFLSANQPKTGMVSAVAFESIVKLVAFVGGALILIYGVFGGPSEIFTKAMADEGLADLFVLNEGQFRL